MNKLVSILIPAYNSEKWVGAAIESAISQTWSKKEIIIVDDGSTDNTLQVLKMYESKLVKILYQKNMGASAARNKALQYAQGDYIQWLDADDLLAPDKIYRQLNTADCQDERTLLSSSWATFFHNYKKEKFTPSRLWQDLSPVEWLIILMKENQWMAIESWLVSRKLTEISGPWNERLLRNNDGEYFCRVICKSKKIKFIPDSKSYCRIGIESSISSCLNISKGKQESLLESIILSINYLLSLENSERTRFACLNYLQSNMIFISSEYADIMRKANEMAAALGGTLVAPDYGWKFELLKCLFGKNVAVASQRIKRRMKDRVVMKLEMLKGTISGD